jgi:hypothetical protein
VTPSWPHRSAEHPIRACFNAAPSAFLVEVVKGLPHGM